MLKGRPNSEHFSGWDFVSFRESILHRNALLKNVFHRQYTIQFRAIIHPLSPGHVLFFDSKIIVGVEF